MTDSNLEKLAYMKQDCHIATSGACNRPWNG